MNRNEIFFSILLIELLISFGAVKVCKRSPFRITKMAVRSEWVVSSVLKMPLLFPRLMFKSVFFLLQTEVMNIILRIERGLCD